MTWLLKNGDTSREFPTKEEAQDAKAELAGLATGLTIEEKETATETETAASDDVDADYIKMPYNEDSDPEPETDGGQKGGCPACGALSKKIYRCSECGHDLAGIRTGVGMGGRP